MNVVESIPASVLNTDMYARLLVLAMAGLTGCGHLAPWSESPLDYVEIYRGVEHPYQLRVLTQVQVYDLIPRRYVSWEWIPLGRRRRRRRI